LLSRFPLGHRFRRLRWCPPHALLMAGLALVTFAGIGAEMLLPKLQRAGLMPPPPVTATPPPSSRAAYLELLSFR
jgi:hypothetical protein